MSDKVYHIRRLTGKRRKMWMRSEIKRNHLIKNKLLKKILTSYVITLTIAASFSIVFMTTCEQVKGEKEQKLLKLVDNNKNKIQNTDDSTLRMLRKKASDLTLGIEGKTINTESNIETTITKKTIEDAIETSKTESTIESTVGTTLTESTIEDAIETSKTERTTESITIQADNSTSRNVSGKYWLKWLNNDSSVKNKVNGSFNLKKSSLGKKSVLLWLKKLTRKEDGDSKVNGSFDFKKSSLKKRLVRKNLLESMTVSVFGNVSKGEKKEIRIEDSQGVEVVGVKFTAATDLKNVKVTIVKLKSKPEEVVEPSKKKFSVYRYLDIKLTADDEYVKEEDIQALKFSFQVEQAWIADNGIDKKSIKLMRYHDGVWQNLSTTVVGQDDTYVYYESETPGCSTFVIVGSKIVEAHGPYVNNGVDIPWTVIIIIVASSTSILVAILFRGRYIYFEEDSYSEESDRQSVEENVKEEMSFSQEEIPL
jgi:PGF-pre-PGF domain-containing protein